MAGDSADDDASIVVKAPGLPEVTRDSLFKEIYGNLLARDLGIHTPRPALVVLSPEFVASVSSMLAGRGLKIEPGLAAGTEYLPGGLAAPVLDVDLTSDELEQAARIYAFDLLIQNIDRRPEKPNCAQRGGQIIAYDFEMAFSFLLAIGLQDQPWEVSKHGLGPAHLFYPVLRLALVDWTPFAADLVDLSDE